MKKTAILPVLVAAISLLSCAKGERPDTRIGSQDETMEYALQATMVGIREFSAQRAAAFLTYNLQQESGGHVNTDVNHDIKLDLSDEEDGRPKIQLTVDDQVSRVRMSSNCNEINISTASTQEMILIIYTKCDSSVDGKNTILVKPYPIFLGSSVFNGQTPFLLTTVKSDSHNKFKDFYVSGQSDFHRPTHRVDFDTEVQRIIFENNQHRTIQ